MTRTEVAEVLAVCAAAFPHVTISKETAAVYAEMLKDIDRDAALQAARTAIATSDYFPSVAMLRRLARQAAGLGAPSPAKAWAEIRAAVAAGGQPSFSHPAIAKAVEVIGWWEIRTSDNLVGLRAQFWKVYDDASQDEALAALEAAQRKELE